MTDPGRHRAVRPAPPEICPVCGAAVPRSAVACPECGADADTGWNDEKTVYDGTDLPDTEFNYDEYVKREFGDTGETARTRTRLWLGLAVLVLLAIVIVLIVGRSR